MTQEPDNRWTSWEAWKRLCALGRCADDVVAQLQGFAQHRFHHYVRRAGAALAVAVRESVSAADAWHLFETHLLVKSTREGKRYKDWLFARLDEMAGPPAGVIESGASLIMRDVVREHLRREMAPRQQVSLHLPLTAGEGTALTLAELLPGPGDPVADVARGEYPGLAKALAERLFATIPVRVRVAILAKLLGLSLAEPAVLAAAGCGKSVLHEAYGAFREVLRAEATEVVSGEGPAGAAELLARVALEIQALVFAWAGAEKACAAFFKDGEGAVCI